MIRKQGDDLNRDADKNDLMATLETCLREHSREKAVAVILAAVQGGMSIEELYSGVLEPFLESVGRTWQEGKAAVWEEHLVVSAIRTAVDALYPTVVRQKADRPALPLTVAFFCPPEETHDLGLRMLSDRFDLRGFRTVYVGAMTPVDQMIACAREVAADVVCLSASTHFQRVALLSIVHRLRDGLPRTRLIVGGPAFAHSEAGWEEHTVDSVTDLLDELASDAEARMGAEDGAAKDTP